jgi:ribosomal protein L11 methylase PrmA
VLIQHEAAMVNLLSPNGILLMSGLLKEDEEIIVEVFNKLKLIKREQKQNWLSFLFAI